MASLPRTRQAAMRGCTEALRAVMLGYRDRMENGLRGTGMTLPQLRMLKAIAAQHGDGSAASIARTCQVTPQTLQSMLTRATREGWITRGTSERNGRILTATLTATGRQRLQQGMDLAEAMEQEVWQGIPVQALHAVEETLRQVLRNLDDTRF